MDYSNSPEVLRESPRFRNIPIISYHKSFPSTSLPDDILAGTLNVNPYDDLDSEPTRSRKQYADFSLIDWNYEYLSFSKFNRERLLHSTRIQMFIHTNIRWFILLFSSFIMGVITIFLDYYSTYLHDIRSGICSDAIWRLKSQCESNNNSYGKWSDWTSVTLSFIHNETFKKMNNFIVFFTLSLILGVASTILCVRQGNHAAKSGIAEIKLILAGYYIQDFLNIEMLANKTISLIFVVASGLYLGYEGPLVHLSCGIINFLIDKFPLGTNGNEALRRELLSSGIAVGIGLAFNAPIGGVLFGLEQIQSFFPIDKLMWNAFICSTLSVTLLQTLHPFKSVNIKESFEVNLKNNWLVLEFFPYMFLGLLCGFMGIVFNKTNTKFAKMRFLHIRDNFKLKIIEVVIVVLVTNLFSYRFALTSTTLSEMLDNLFTDCTTDSVNPLCQVKTDKFPFEMVGLLLFTVIQAFLLTAYTYGCSVPGGVLMPSLVIGGLVGRLTGLILEYIQNSHPASSLFINCFNENQQCISVASYSLVGSGAFLAAVTKMNVTVVVILFEMTGAITYIIPIMLGVFFARFLNDLLLDMSIYELWLIITKQPYLTPDLEDQLTSSEMAAISCEQLMKDTEFLSIIYEDDLNTLQDLNNLIKIKHEDMKYGYPILKSREEPHLIGHVSHSDLVYEFEKLNNENVISMDTPVQFSTNDLGYCSMKHLLVSLSELYIVNSSFKLLTVYEMIDKLKLTNLFVCYDGTGYEFKGLVNRDDLIEYVNGEGTDRGQYQSL